MTKFALLLFTITIVNITALGEIRNGYDTSLVQAKETLNCLQNLLVIGKAYKLNEHEKKLSSSQKEKLKREIHRIQQLIRWQEITESMLEQFRAIAPALYYEIDSLKDMDGKSIDIYVKFLPYWEMEFSASGSTNLSQIKNSNHVYTSDYGDHTVSVKVCFNEIKALSILAHEFGHVKYIVPNIASYTKFFKKSYPNMRIRPIMFGHSFKDPSSDIAKDYERRFRVLFKQFKRNNELSINNLTLNLRQ